MSTTGAYCILLYCNLNFDHLVVGSWWRRLWPQKQAKYFTLKSVTNLKSFLFKFAEPFILIQLTNQLNSKELLPSSVFKVIVKDLNHVWSLLPLFLPSQTLSTNQLSNWQLRCIVKETIFGFFILQPQLTGLVSSFRCFWNKIKLILSIMSIIRVWNRGTYRICTLCNNISITRCYPLISEICPSLFICSQFQNTKIEIVKKLSPRFMTGDGTLTTSMFYTEPRNQPVFWI